MRPSDREDLPRTSLSWVEAGHKTALAIVANTWGSAPRRAGAILAIREDGHFEGSVSGGCVEGAVITEAMASMTDGQPRLLEYGVDDGTAFAAGLACGGTIHIVLLPVVETGLPRATLEQLVAYRAARTPVAMLTDTNDWSITLIENAASDDRLTARLATDRSGLDGAVFTHIHNPPLRLVTVGAVHIAAPLLNMAQQLGYDTTLIDPRPAFASADRFPGVTLVDDWPDEVLTPADLDTRTALVTLTHDPKIDDRALTIALGSQAFYIGSLGSRRTHAARRQRLAAAGASPDALARISGPVGLDIGAATPAEIALSILAELTARLRQKDI